MLPEVWAICVWQTSRIKSNRKNVDSQMLPDDPRCSQMLPEVWANFLTDFQNKRQPEKCRLPDAPRCAQMLPDAPRGSQMLPDAPRCSQKLPEAPRCFQMLPDAARCWCFFDILQLNIDFCYEKQENVKIQCFRCCQPLIFFLICN